MQENLSEARAVLGDLDIGAAGEAARDWDRRIGRIAGAARACAWLTAGAGAGACGALVCHYFDGAARGGLTFVVGAFIIFAIWRAYRGFCFPPTASGLLRDEIEDRLMTAETAMGVVNFIRRRKRA